MDTHMEKVMLSTLRQLTLAFDTDAGVDRDSFNQALNTIRKNIGPNASSILTDAMEVDGNTYYYPAKGDGIHVWKRMLAAYKQELALDKVGK